MPEELRDRVDVRFLIERFAAETRFRAAAFPRRDETAAAIPAHLDADVSESLLHPTPRALDAGVERRSPGMCVERNGFAGLAAEQLIDRHVGALAFDVP